MGTSPLRLSYEEHPWEVSPPVSHRIGSLETQRLARPYKAAVPVPVASVDLLPLISRDAREAAAAAASKIVEFDSEMADSPAPMPAILLRTESASSSRIENLTAGARRIAAATLGVEDHENALLIADNVNAMRVALTHPDLTSPEDLLNLHRALLEHSQPEIAGQFRAQQVWIGGGSLSPHGSTFIPPHHTRVPGLIDDLLTFIARRDIPPLIHSALAHAQFETIHPFEDGNGRVGRVLIHSMLALGVPLKSSTIPVSAGLLTDPEGYFSALTAYRDGDPSAIVSAVSHGALEAIENGRVLARELLTIREGWSSRVDARSDSIAWTLIDLLFTQPVVNAGFVATRLGVSDRGARNALDLLENAGVLRRTQTRQERRRNVVWHSDELLNALDSFAARAGRRRPGLRGPRIRLDSNLW